MKFMTKLFIKQFTHFAFVFFVTFSQPNSAKFCELIYPGRFRLFLLSGDGGGIHQLRQGE